MHKNLIIIGCVLLFYPIHATHIAVIGCGYVGLTCTAILAHAGHTISCIDTDQHKIDTLRAQQLPFYEPGLPELLFDVKTNSRITFTTSLDTTIVPDIYYICVPTPLNCGGACDCSYLYAAYDTIVDTLSPNSSAIICIKSTIPPGTMSSLIARTQESTNRPPQLVYNPEFMREGSALLDMRTRNPIVLGAKSETACNTIQQLLRGALPEVSQIITTNFETAELIKYAWNSFSAIRISYINELARMCRTVGADIAPVTQALAASEQLLQTKDLKPGPGYGGSCLPKDTAAFARVLANCGLDTTLVHRAIESNLCHKKQLLVDICDLVQPTRSPQIITLLGLSFKANTNDIRNSLALDIIPLLLEQGVIVKAYDPKAMPAMHALFSKVQYCNCAYEAIEDTDGIILLTEWQEFKELDLTQVAALCRKKRIIDLRNLYPPALLQSHGFEYLTMGSL